MSTSAALPDPRPAPARASDLAPVCLPGPPPAGAPEPGPIHQPDLATAAAQVAACLTRRERRAGRAGVVVIDGLTGSGKTTLAAAVCSEIARLSRTARVIGMDDLVPGWQGLATGVERAAKLLRGLPRTQVATWDWARMRPGPHLHVDVSGGRVLVLEGCGALAAAAQELAVPVVRVLVGAPAAVRHARVAGRDAYTWDVAAWEEQERSLARAWRTHPRWEPDVVVRTTG